MSSDDISCDDISGVVEGRDVQPRDIGQAMGQGRAMKSVCGLLLWLYKRILWLYPRTHRVDFGPEMAWVFEQSLDEAAKRGLNRLLSVSLRELRDAPGAILLANLQAGVATLGRAVALLRPDRVSIGRDRGNRMAEQERIRWEPRLSRAKIVQLYEQDARGIVDESLIGEVGSALYARAESILLVSRQKLRCPRCQMVFDLGDVRRDEDVVRCPEQGCGWETTFLVCRYSWRRRHLFSGSMLPVLERYRAEYPLATSPRIKLQLIDRLLHDFGRDPRTGELRWPSVGHLVEGKSPRTVDLLEGLTYSQASTPGLRETNEQWLEMLRRSRAPVSGADSRCGA
jgi:hypothetical protein